jgi:GTP-binding protein
VESFTVERDDDGSYVVVGRDAERAVALNDLTNPEAIVVVHDRLKRLGVDRALARAGAQPGDRVRIGRLMFDYEDE